MTHDKPEEGKVYALIGADGPSIEHGNTWAESEVTSYIHPNTGCRKDGDLQYVTCAKGAGPTCSLCGVRYWVSEEVKK